MLGAIIGDMCGSIYGFSPIKGYDFELFNEKATYSDDTVLTIAVADALMNKKDLAKNLAQYAGKDFFRGYGARFYDWMYGDHEPYGSFGNCSAMRVSSVGFLGKSEEEVIELAKWSAMPTHNHLDDTKGAQAVALAIYLAKTASSKKEIKNAIETKFKYNLSRTLKEIESNYSFKATRQQSIPEAIICFLESSDYESAIRNAIWLKGDTGTQACIAGGIAQAYYGEIPSKLHDLVYEYLPKQFLDILHQFHIYQSYELEIKYTPLSDENIEKILSFIPYFESTDEFFIPPKFIFEKPINPHNPKAKPIQISISNDLEVDQGIKDFTGVLQETSFLIESCDWKNWYLDVEIFTQKERINNLDTLTIRMVLSSFFKDNTYPKELILAMCAKKGHILLFLKRLKKILYER